MSDRYVYKVDEETFAVSLWDTDNGPVTDAPNIYQPNWPDNTPWASYEEAELWAQRFIASWIDFRNGRPGSSPSEPFLPWTEEDEQKQQEFEEKLRNNRV